MKWVLREGGRLIGWKAQCVGTVDGMFGGKRFCKHYGFCEKRFYIGWSGWVCSALGAGWER